jgi:hypothetical protein
MYKGEVKDLREMVTWLNCELEKTRVPANAAELAYQDKLVGMIKSGLFIGSIKYHREITRCSLKDAADHCRALRARILTGEFGQFDPSIDPERFSR